MTPTKQTYTIEFYKTFTGEVAGIQYSTSALVRLSRIANDSVADVITALNKEKATVVSIGLDDV